MVKVRPMSRWIITDEGELFHYSSPILRGKLFVRSLQEQDFVPLLRNLGFIGLQQGPRGIGINFRPTTVSPAALAALGYWMCDHLPTRLWLIILEPGQCVELYTSIGRALERIETLMDERRGAAARGSFSKEPIALKAMPTSALGSLFVAWRRFGPGSEFSSLRELLRLQLADRYVLLRPDTEAARFVIADAGTGLRIPDANWARAQIGHPVTDMPDKAYGEWVSETFRSVLVAGEPQLDAVEAKIFWPRTGRVLRRYSRLILPVQDGGCARLLSANEPAGGINGRLEAA
jgi:hypothetical protein